MSLQINFRIHDSGPEGAPIYYVNNSMCTPGERDVYHLGGDSKGGSIIAFGQFYSASGNITLELANPSDELQVVA